MIRVSLRPHRTIFSIFLLICTLQCCFGQVLTPPYFNLAQGRRIAASSTCGEDVPEPELFCKLVGANAEGENIVIQGQVSAVNLGIYCIFGIFGENWCRYEVPIIIMVILFVRLVHLNFL